MLLLLLQNWFRSYSDQDTESTKCIFYVLHYSQVIILSKLYTKQEVMIYL